MRGVDGKRSFSSSAVKLTHSGFKDSSGISSKNVSKGGSCNSSSSNRSFDPDLTTWILSSESAVLIGDLIWLSTSDLASSKASDNDASIEAESYTYVKILVKFTIYSFNYLLEICWRLSAASFLITNM